MKEKDIVDFNKEPYEKISNSCGMLETYIKHKDGSLESVECELCHTCDKAEEYFEKLFKDNECDQPIEINSPICPKCNKPMKTYVNNGVVTEVNYPNPDGEIGYYPIFKCESCQKEYALMPIPLIHNWNHDCYYTGGKDYVQDKDLEKFCFDLSTDIYQNIKQYIERKLHPQDVLDVNLTDFNLKTWNSCAIEHRLSKMLYEKGLKK